MAGSSSSKALEALTNLIQCEKDLLDVRANGGRLKWSLYRMITSSVYGSGSKNRLTLTLVWKAGQSGRKIVRGVDVIITGWSAGTILTWCTLCRTLPKIIIFRCPINNILYSIYSSGSIHVRTYLRLVLLGWSHFLCHWSHCTCSSLALSQSLSTHCCRQYWADQSLSVWAHGYHHKTLQSHLVSS